MIIRIIHGHSHYATNPMFCPLSFLFMRLFVLNSRCPSCVSKLTMAANLIARHPVHSSHCTALFFASLVHTHHNKMDVRNACSALSMTASARCCSRHTFRPPSGLMPSRPPPTSLIGARANLVTTPPPLSCSLVPRLPTTISEYLGASVTQISPPLHHTNSRHDQCAVCFLAIPLIRKDTSAITWTAKELLSHVMSPSTRPVFHLCRDNTLQQHRPNRTHHSSRTRF